MFVLEKKTDTFFIFLLLMVIYEQNYGTVKYNYDAYNINIHNMK